MKINPVNIRFGVLCNDTQILVWQEIVIKKLVAEVGIDLELLIIASDHNINSPQTSNLVEASSKSGILLKTYISYLKKKSRALQEVKAHSLFKDIPHIHCTINKNQDGSAKLENREIEKIASAQLDFIIDFSSARLIGEVVNVPKYGIWSYCHGDPEKYKGGDYYFRELYNEDVLTRACLIRSTIEPDTSMLLWDGYLKTNVFHIKNIDQIYFESTGWPLLICRDIQYNNAKATFRSRNIVEGEFFPPLHNLELLGFFLIRLKLLCKKAVKSLLYTDYWNIGITQSPIQEFLNPQRTPSITWFPNLPNAGFKADPFGIYFKDQLHILYEEFYFDEGIGKTSRLLFNNGQFSDNKVVIDEKFHMSYPYIFEYGDGIYCIPETYQANQVRLYKAEGSLDKWKLEKVLIENYAGIDNTLFKYDNTWFLFSTNKDSGAHYNLNIHYSDNIFGPWKGHYKNPVKTDIRSARPAGTMFMHNGDIFRPSMDYSEKIEGRIKINKILTLSNQDFNEEVHTVVEPFKDTDFSDKVHTLSQVGSYTLVDGAKELFVLRNFKALKYKFSTILRKLKKV